MAIKQTEPSIKQTEQSIKQPTIKQTEQTITQTITQTNEPNKELEYIKEELETNIPEIFTYNIEVFLNACNKRKKILMYIYNKLLIAEHDLIYAISNNNLLCNIIYDQSKVFVNVNKKLYNIIYKVIVRIAHIHKKYKRKENKIKLQNN